MLQSPWSLFRNKEQVCGQDAVSSENTVLGCIALVAGTTVGAGVLALPSVTFPAGVIPSTCLLLLIWGYTLLSGLLIAEVQVRLMQASTAKPIGLLSLIDHHLGSLTAQLSTVAFLFLHYALLVAYVSEGSRSLKIIIRQIFPLAEQLPHALEPVIFVGILGSLIYWGSSSIVRHINNGLVVSLLVAFAGLLGAIAIDIDWTQVGVHDWKAATPAIPIMLIALFYHNVIPVITTRLAGNGKKIRLSLLVGSLIPLGMFLAWNGTVLCSVGSLALNLDFDPLDILRQRLSDSGIEFFISVFVMSAITTSFIGVSYGLLNVWQDLWHPNNGNEQPPHFSINVLTFLPPAGFSGLNPDLFITALSYAGTISVATLYGLIPAILAWRSRYHTDSTLTSDAWVPGGRWVLGGMMAIALALMTL